MSTKVVGRKNQIRSILFVVILMAITIIVILNEYPLNEIVRVIRKAHPFYLLAGIAMMFVFVGCQAFNFFLILKKLKHPVSYGRCIEYAYVGNYFGGITPGASGGQPAQLYYMNKDKIRVDISAITVFFMVFISQIAILTLGGALAVLRPSVLAGSYHWFRYLLLAGSIVMLTLTSALMALMFLKKTIPFLFRLALKAGIQCRLIKKPEAVKARFEAITLSYREKSRIILKHPDLFVKVFVVTLLQWVAYFMVSYLVYLSLGYRKYDAPDLMAGQALINIATAAVPLPGSVGIAENAFLNVFSRFYSDKELPSAMILSRIINFYMPLFISFFVYLAVHWRAIKQKKLQNSNNTQNK